MAIFYHAQTRSFFNTVTHAIKSIPAQAVEISQDLHAQLLIGEAAGNTILIGEDGQPFLVAPEVDPNAPLISEREWRDTEIESVKWLRERHRDEVDSARPTTMTVKQSGELLDYVQALRDWPASKHFPAKEYRPVAPDWVTEHAR